MALRIIILVSLAALTACTSPLTSESLVENPPPATDWIDVPLAPDTYIETDSAYREGIYEIPVAAHSALEFKVAMNEGDPIVYYWSTESSQTDLLGVEFHGHTERVGEEPGTVMFYKIHSDGRESGGLKAPFSGIHGWYLNNESAEDIVILLRVAGFYREIPNQL